MKTTRVVTNRPNILGGICSFLLWLVVAGTATEPPRTGGANKPTKGTHLSPGRDGEIQYKGFREKPTPHRFFRLRVFLVASGNNTPRQSNLVSWVKLFTCRTSIATQPSPTRAGTPGLKIPAFSPAISSTVSPKILVWSSLWQHGSQRADCALFEAEEESETCIGFRGDNWRAT